MKSLLINSHYLLLSFIGIVASSVALTIGGCGESGSPVAVEPSDTLAATNASLHTDSDLTLNHKEFDCLDCEIDPPSFQPSVEFLNCNPGLFGEPNSCMTVVNTPTDVVNANDGLLSLREAVSITPRSGYELHIFFSTSVINQGSVALSRGKLTIPQDLKIIGPAQGSLVISGNNSFTLFDIPGNATVQLVDLKVQQGTNTSVQGEGGAFLNNGHLILDNVVVSDSVAKYGGGIHNSGHLTLNGTTMIRSNSAVFEGGGVYNEGTLTLNGSAVITQNRAGSGGGVYGFNLSRTFAVNGSRDPKVAVTNNVPDDWKCSHRACF